MNSLGDLWLITMVLALLIARGYGMLLAIPPLMKAGQGWVIRLPMALAISLPSFIPAYQLATQDFMIANIGMLALREFIFGMLAGIFFLPLFAVPRAAGALIDQQAGLMSIQLFDPTAAERTSTVFADFFEHCALFLFVAAGGFAMLSEMYAVSYSLWPPTETGFPNLHQVMTLIPAGFGKMLAISIAYAAPVAVLLVVLEYGIGLIGRAAPQINILTTSVAIKMVAAILILLVGSSRLIDDYSVMLSATLDEGEAFLTAVFRNAR